MFLQYILDFTMSDLKTRQTFTNIIHVSKFSNFTSDTLTNVSHEILEVCTVIKEREQVI